MLKETPIAFIGSGMMAESMIKGMLNQGLVEPQGIIASGPRPERAAELAKRYGIRTTTDNRSAADFAEIVVLGVKPQVLPHLLPELRGHLSRSSLILSILAGVRISSLLFGTGHPAIVRCMPNTPAQVGLGMTVPPSKSIRLSASRLRRFSRRWVKRCSWTTRIIWTWRPPSAALGRLTSSCSWRR